ncbi:DUF1302 domain-containing protein [Limnobacter parvus]|uniref:DUF1302 domain-containing protein n=1 Tax=Limnobacter parvus TaxID=2939690 RepID=A0ABT1XCQ2_9BURK|nr:DUF1302 domain-containing protein [Limnobacter parvus]MCR2745058.1 DUF1302 domain-containing protein [Limnobacter parvus]
MNKHSFSKTKTNVAVRNMFAAAVLAAAAMPAQAKDFKIGDFDLSINSTISAGTSFRVENRDRALYSQGNVSSDGANGTGFSNTSDDGNLNFDKGDAFSTIIKGVHDFELKKDNYGFFSRVKWFYDHTLNNDEVFHGHEPTSNARNQKLNDSGFHPYARFDGIDVLDAFFYMNTTVADKPLDFRLGRQVISWGESLFIPSAISGLNTIDVSAFRRPGADLKEGFTPTEMLYFNLGVTDNTSLEAFYQLKWRKTVPEGCGTYFSTNDFAADGCDRLAFAAPLPDSTNLAPGFAVQGGPVVRSADNQPDDNGQFGFALRNYVSSLDTEFGAYYLNYHSRLPLISVRASNTPTPAQLPLGPGGALVNSELVGLTPGNALPRALAGGGGSYFVDYAEDIPVFGLSASTNLGGWSVAGEISLAQDVPIQLNANDLLASTLGAGVGTAGNPLDQRIRALAPGQAFQGFDRFDVTQIQSAFIKTFDRALNSSQVVFIAEVGAVFVNGLPDVAPGQRYGRNPVFGTVRGNEGYVTDFSWGYRLRSQATYRDAFLGVDLIPSIAWSHDVDGWSPEPGQVFNEGRQSVGLGLGFEFDANTKGSINYTTFTNAADFDPLRDRDFISLTGSYSF